MAWQLSAEVSAYVQIHGDDMTAAEIATLYAIAERASFDGRHARLAWDSDDWKLSRATGSKYPRDVFQRLAERGIEVRVQRGTDKLGRPVYAHKGMQTTYRLPKLLEAEDLTAPLGKGAEESAPNEDLTAPSAVVTAPFEDLTAPSPSFAVLDGDTSSSTRPAYRQRIADAAGAETDEEIEAILKEIKNSATGPIRSIAAYINRMSAEDIHTHADAARTANQERAETTRRANLADLRRQIGTMTQCAHRVNGGWYPHPDTGLPWQCGSCRTAAQYDPDAYTEQLEAALTQLGDEP